MTRRGRTTVVAGALLLVAAALLGLRRLAPDIRNDAPGPAALPAVAASPPAAVPSALLEAVPTGRSALDLSPASAAHLSFDAPASIDPSGRALHVETTLDAQLTRDLWAVLDRGRVALGHVVVMEPGGRLLAYLSTDLERFPPTRTYPAASLIKVVTAAAALNEAPGIAKETCHFVGSPYRLTPSRLDPPRRGNQVSVRRALAQSNNQCFAQLAVHRIGARALLEAIDRFGLTSRPAAGHARGLVEPPGDDRYALGRLASGLDGTHITPLHAAQIGGVLADGVRPSPYWVERVTTASGEALALPPRTAEERVLTSKLASDLRDMLVDTVARGTARRAFHTRRGRPLLQGIDVAGKTGSLSGDDPKGRYEWFVGVAPADAPRLVVATVAVQGDLYWLSASQLAAEVFKVLLCPKGVCSLEAAGRFSTTRVAHAPGGEAPG